MLYIVATPIGNLEDITARAVSVLGEVDIVLAEDTRKTGFLLSRLGIKKRLVSFYEHNEQKKIPQIIEELKRGKKIALVSSAGTPTISDPGYKLIRACREESLAVTSLPGPSSLINCLAQASIPHDKFAFLGYMPRKASARKKILEKARSWGVTLVFFESPHRLLSSLRVMSEILGGCRRIVIGREMTKKFEEVLELSLEEAIIHFSRKQPRGEFVIAIDRGE